MGSISKSRIVLATAVPVVFASYLLLMGITWWYFVIGMFLVILCDLIYLTSSFIETMKPVPNSLSISGKNIIITGGSSGIGFQLAKELVKSNAAHIVLVARNEERLLSSASELNEMKANFQQITHISLDLTSNDVKEKIDDLLKTIKRIDILINCAGFSLPVEFLSLKLSQFKQMIDVNYFGSVNITHAVTPYMCRQKFGQLVFLSSVAGQLGVYGLTAYSPSKYAIRGFAETLYHEVLPYGVGVTLVFPPDTDTPGFEHENTMKPKLTKIISEQAGLWKSEDVAEIIKEGIINRRFMLGFGSDGFFLNALTGGAIPASSVFEFWAHWLEIQQSQFFQEFLVAINPDTQAKESGFCEIISYGIGSISRSIISQYQTALVLCIAENFKIPCHFYDPVHSEAEVNLLEELGLISLVDNEECKRRVSHKTLFVMLHCGKAMYNNLLWSNWEPISLLNVCIVGNAFSSYEERLTFKEFSSAAKYMCKILPYTREIKVKNSFKYDDIFNDTAVHYFPYDLLRNVPSELWKDNAEPERDERDVEIILKR